MTTTADIAAVLAAAGFDARAWTGEHVGERVYVEIAGPATAGLQPSPLRQAKRNLGKVWVRISKDGTRWVVDAEAPSVRQYEEAVLATIVTALVAAGHPAISIYDAP